MTVHLLPMTIQETLYIGSFIVTFIDCDNTFFLISLFKMRHVIFSLNEYVMLYTATGVRCTGLVDDIIARRRKPSQGFRYRRHDRIAVYQLAPCYRMSTGVCRENSVVCEASITPRPRRADRAAHIPGQNHRRPSMCGALVDATATPRSRTK